MPRTSNLYLTLLACTLVEFIHNGYENYVYWKFTHISFGPNAHYLKGIKFLFILFSWDNNLSRAEGGNTRCHLNLWFVGAENFLFNADYLWKQFLLSKLDYFFFFSVMFPSTIHYWYYYPRTRMCLLRETTPRNKFLWSAVLFVRTEINA